MYPLDVLARLGVIQIIPQVGQCLTVPVHAMLTVKVFGVCNKFHVLHSSSTDTSPRAHPKSSPTRGHLSRHPHSPRSRAKSQDLEQITTSLNKMNEQLQSVMSMLNLQTTTTSSSVQHRLPGQDAHTPAAANDYPTSHVYSYGRPYRYDAYSRPNEYARYPVDQPMGGYLPASLQNSSLPQSNFHPPPMRETADEALERKWKSYFGGWCE